MRAMPMEVGIQMVEVVVAFILGMILVMWLVPMGWNAIFTQEKSISPLTGAVLDPEEVMTHLIINFYMGFFFLNPSIFFLSFYLWRRYVFIFVMLFLFTFFSFNFIAQFACACFFVRACICVCPKFAGCVCMYV